MASSEEQVNGMEAGVAVPDIITLMRDDHQRLRLQIEQAIADGDLHQLLKGTFAEQLWIHEWCEVTVFWPVLRSALPSTAEFVQEHLDAQENLMNWLVQGSAEAESEETLSAKMNDFLGYLATEERDAWPKATSAIGLEHLLALGSTFNDLKGQSTMPLRAGITDAPAATTGTDAALPANSAQPGLSTP